MAIVGCQVIVSRGKMIVIAAEFKVVRSTENVEFPDHDLWVSF